LAVKRHPLKRLSAPWGPASTRAMTRRSTVQLFRAADERLTDYLRRLNEGDAAEAGTGGGSRMQNLGERIAAIRAARDRRRSLLAELERTGESQISLTDPDSRAMAGHTKLGVGYNVQVAVDAKHKLIVEQAVTNQVVDMGLLTQTAEPARAILGVERIDVVADRGYFKIEDIEACEKARITLHVAQPQRGLRRRRRWRDRLHRVRDPVLAADHRR
jgi:transposase